MVTLGSLWLAIVLSAVFVWLASALVWMVLPHHRSDWKGLPDEEAFRAAVNPQDVPRGQYMVPFSYGAPRDPEVARKYEEGPVALLTLVPPGAPTMGGKMVASFVFYLVVSFVVAYLASRTLAAGAEYMAVFRVVGTTAWLAYAFAIVPDSIWFGRLWNSTLKGFLDGLLYALLTAGAFAWLWP